MAIDTKLTEQINGIVFDTLARRGSVYIDGIGSLKPEAAALNVEMNGRTVSFPVYRITLDKSATTGIDLKSQILSLNGVNKSNLDGNFYEWLNECGFRNNSGDFSIDGVLASEKGTIIMSDKLNGYLNPVPTPKASVMPKKANKQKTRIVVIILIVICAALVGMTIYSNVSGKMDFMSWLVTSSNKAENTEAITPVTVAEERLEQKETGKTEEIINEEREITAVPEETKEVKINSGLVSADTSKEIYYIVAGTFRSMENAENFLQSISKEYKNAQVHTFGKRHFVTIDGFADRAEAQRANNRYFRNLQCWILHVKDNKIIE